MNLKEKLSGITTSEPSKAVEHLRQKEAKPWLRVYSTHIARRVLAILRENKDLNQGKLAESLNVSKQYINKMVKGQTNLTLETIYKLSKALNTELISFPQYEYSVIEKINTIEISGISAPLTIENIPEDIRAWGREYNYYAVDEKFTASTELTPSEYHSRNRKQIAA